MRELFWSLLINIFMSKGEKIMMAMFFAQRVILGKADWGTDRTSVPPVLRPQVAEILLDSGLPQLVPSEYGGTLKQ